MKVATTAELMVPAPPMEVFDTFINDEAFVAFCQRVGPFAAIVEATTEGELAVGVKRAVRMDDGLELEESIVAHDRPRQHVYEWSNPALPLGALIRRARGEWLFEAHDTGTRVQWRYTFTLRSPMLWPIGKLVAIGFRRWMQAALECGKESLE